MTEKEAILRDLKVIAILDDKIDYSDHENIGAVLKLNPKSLFSTEYGDRYLERVRKMYDGDDYEKTCILCGSPLDGDGPICSNCYKMITIGNAKIPERPAPIHAETEEEPVAEETQAEPPVEEQSTENEESAIEEQPAEAEEPASEEAPSEQEETVEDTSEPEPEATAEESTPEEPADEKPAPAVTPIVSFDAEAAKAAAEEQKQEDGFADDAKEVQQTYDEIEQDVVDPKAKKIYVWRVLVMLFVVACFAIGIVCGLVLMIRRAGNTSTQYSEVVIEQSVDTVPGEYNL